MLGKADATPMIAVKDIDRAKQFYEGKLGLASQDVGVSDVFMLKSGDTELSVYKSEFAGTNKATLLTFDVDDIEAEVRELKGKGISFEHYELEGLTAEGDIYSGPGMKTAWFKDPDGNILSLIQEG
jgi:catechol 2,3-dioxygenase-like lactoylglutathione lyase family enzyme